MSAPEEATPDQRPYDRIAEEAIVASGLVAPNQLRLVLDLRDTLAASRANVPLAVLFLQRGYLTLSQANYLLRDTADRLLFCNECHSHRFVLAAELTAESVNCTKCSMDLSIAPRDVLLRDGGDGDDDEDAPEDAPEESLVGQSVGGFVVGYEVETGRYAGWFRADDANHERVLMLRPIPSQFKRNADLFKRLREDFYRCKLVVASAKPDNFDLVQVLGSHYVTQTAIDGRSITEIVTQDGPMPLEEVIKVMTPVAELAVAGHRQDLIDFDFNPDLISVDDFGRVKVMDLSTGYLHSDDIEALRFRAPERIDHQPVNEPADIYSFLAVCYFMLTGKPPFPGDDLQEVAEAVKAGSFVGIGECLPQLEPAMREIIQKGMATSPAERQSDFKEILDTLRHLPDLIKRAQAPVARTTERQTERRSVTEPPRVPGGTARPTSRISGAAFRERLGTARYTRPPETEAGGPAGTESGAAEAATGATDRPTTGDDLEDARLQIAEFGRRAHDFMKLRRYTLAIKALSRILDFEGKSPEFESEIANARKAIRILEQQKAKG